MGNTPPAFSRPSEPGHLPDWRLRVLDDSFLWNNVFRPISLVDNDGALHNIRHGLGDSVMWWIGADCCDLLTQVAPTMPPVTLSAEMVPDTYGLAFFEKPIAGTDAWNPDLAIHVDAIQWWPTMLVRDELLCLSVGTWSANYQFVDGRPWPLGYSDWPYGYDTDHVLDRVPDHAVASIVEDRQLLAALWQLSAQTNLTATEERKPYRAQAKRLARHGLDPSPTRIINLNRKTRRRHTGPAGDREYTCQWIVKPHWRQQPYGPGRSLRKAILIDQHVKGPEDKPLRVRDTVKVWTQPPPP